MNNWYTLKECFVLSGSKFPFEVDWFAIYKDNEEYLNIKITGLDESGRYLHNLKEFKNGEKTLGKLEGEYKQFYPSKFREYNESFDKLVEE